MSLKQLRPKEDHKKESEETPKYDIKSSEARKYIVGGAAVFIPDLCEALKQDWYPRLSYDEIKNTPYLYNEMKNKIYEDWDATRTEDGIGWANFTISRLLPEWLPAREWTEGSTAEQRSYQEYRFFMRLVRNPKKLQKLYDVISQIPKVPAEPEPENNEGSEHKERPPSPEIIYNESMDAIGELWKYLFNYKSLPGPKTDIDDIIESTIKYRLYYLKALPIDDRTALIHQMQQLHLACVGFLKHARDVLAQEPRVDK